MGAAVTSAAEPTTIAPSTAPKPKPMNDASAKPLLSFAMLAAHYAGWDARWQEAYGRDGVLCAGGRATLPPHANRGGGRADSDRRSFPGWARPALRAAPGTRGAGRSARHRSSSHRALGAAHGPGHGQLDGRAR